MCLRMRENRSFAGRHPRLHHHNHSLRYFSLSALRLSVSGTTHVCLARQNKSSRAVRDGTAYFNANRSITARYTQICGGTHAVRHNNSSIVRLVNYSQCHRRKGPDTAGRRAIIRTSLPVAKSSTSSAAVRRECRLCRVAGNTV